MAKTGNFAGGPTLSVRALRVARALAATMFADGAEPEPRRLDAFTADLAEFARSCGPKTRLALRASIVALQWSPAWVIGRPLPFTSLATEEKRRYFEKAESKSLPLVYQGAKTVFAILWYELNPDQLPAVVRKEPRAGADYVALRKSA